MTSSTCLVEDDGGHGLYQAGKRHGDAGHQQQACGAGLGRNEGLVDVIRHLQARV